MTRCATATGRVIQLNLAIDKSGNAAYRQAFPAEEFARRLACVRAIMAERDLDGLLVSGPDNICYLTGLSYHGYFAYQLLVVARSGTPCLITRAMEAPTIRDEVPNVRHCPYPDSPRSADQASSALSEPVLVTIETLIAQGLAGARLGFEANSAYLAYGIASGIQDGLPKASFEDASDIVGQCKLVKSAREIEYVRRAAEVTDAMLYAAIETAGVGVHQRDIMASIYQAMILGGSTYPGFVPLIRSSAEIDHEHSTWEDKSLQHGDKFFMEMSGCIRRYHAPAGRLIFIGEAAPQTLKAQAICERAFDATVRALQPGAIAAEVYAAWQSQIDRAGVSGYRRQHCGYSVGIGFPPSWSGSGVPTGLRHDSKLEIQKNMVFHLMSAMFHTNKGDYFISNGVVVTDSGCEVLTKVPHTVTVR